MSSAHSSRTAAVVAILCASFGCGSSGASAPSSASPIAPTGCAAGYLCFNVVPGGPGPLPPSRVVLVWTPPNESRPPEIAEIARLAGTERSIAVPLASIPPPRTTLDLGQAWGYIVVQSLDSAAAPDLKGSSGVAYMMLVHAIDARQMAPLFKDKFPNGMAQGTAPYTMKKDGMFDDLLLAPPGSVFELYVCPAAGTPCNAEFPNPH